MQTVAFVARKGGVSKTTLAAHFGVAASRSQPVIFVDTDPQKSLAFWWGDREAEQPALMDVPVGKLTSELSKASAQPGLVVIDTPAFDSGIAGAVIQAANLVVIPVKPSQHDFRGVAITVEAVKKAGKPFLLVLTQAVSGASLTVQARELLSQTGPVATSVMHNRVSYAGSMTDGRTVLETDPSSRAAAEVNDIQIEILQSLRQAVKKENRNG